MDRGIVFLVHRCRERQLIRPDRDDVTVIEPALIAELAVHCQAIDAAQILDIETVAVVSEDRRVMTTDLVIVMVAAAGWIRRGNANQVLIVRRPSGGLMGGLWELPGGECQAGEKASDALQRHVRTSLGLELQHIEPSGSVTHAFTHRALRLHVFRCEARGRVRRGAADHFEAHEWVAEGALAERPHGATTRKALALLAPQQPTLEESR